MKSATATEIKRHVGENLYLTSVDGKPWATNRYWLAPASKLAPLLDKFNVDPGDGGTYDVNGSIRKRSEDAPKAERFMDLAKYDTPLARVRIAGREAYVSDGAGHYLALFTRPDGEHVGVRTDWLEWLSEAADSYGERYGETRYMLNGQSVAIVADKQVQHGGHYDDERHFVPVTWETTGAEILAVVMTCKLG